MKKLFKQIQEDYQRKYGEPLLIKNSSSIGGGCISQTYKIETNIGNLFLKWNNTIADDIFVREEESLNEFHKHLNEFIVFPKPLLSKKVNLLPGYLLTTFLVQGRSGNDEEKLGRGIAKLHQCSNNYYGFKHNNYCGETLQDNTYKSDWISFYIENRIKHIVSLIQNSRSWYESDQLILDRFLKVVPNLLDYPHRSALIHGDLWSGNYMYTTQVPALIDPCVSYCDREFELGIMTMFGGFSHKVYDAYNEYYPLEHEWKERNLIYQLYHVLNHYYLFGGYYKQQALAIMNRFI